MKSKIRKEPSQKYIRISVLGISLLFISIVFILLFLNQRSADMRVASEKEKMVRESHNLCLILESFFRNRLEDIADIGYSPIISAYYHNKNLGMSMKYGLKTSLLNIERLFSQELERKVCLGKNVYSMILLRDRETRDIVAKYPEDQDIPFNIDHVDCELRSEFHFYNSKKVRQIMVHSPFYYNDEAVADIITFIKIDVISSIINRSQISKDDSVCIVNKSNDIIINSGIPKDTLSAILRSTDISDSKDDSLITIDIRQGNYINKNYLIIHKINKTPFAMLYISPLNLLHKKAKENKTILLTLSITFLIALSILVMLIIDRTKELDRTNLDLKKKINETESAHEKMRKLDRAVDQSPIAIVITDTNGIIEYVNPHTTKIFGYTEQELLGNHAQMLGRDTDYAFFKNIKKKVLTGCDWRGELKDRRKNGKTFWESITVSVVRDDSGKITHLLGVIEDITEKKTLEIQLLQSQKLESIGQLAAGIAHELNTPIQFVGDNLSFLNDSFRDLISLCKIDESRISKDEDLKYLIDEIPTAIEESIEGSKRVSKIVKAMKEFSHPGIEGQTSSDINRIIENTVTVSRNEWKYVANMALNLDTAIPLVQCISGELGQVMLNLIVNAAHSIKEKQLKTGEKEKKGTIEIKTFEKEDKVIITVRDTGTGIPKEIQEKIYDPFFTTKKVGKGTGQGLAISHDVIVNKMHGSIKFETTLYEGTTFIIELPTGEETARTEDFE